MSGLIKGLIYSIPDEAWPYIINGSLLFIALAFGLGALGWAMSRPNPKVRRQRDPHASDCGIRTRGTCDCEDLASFASALREQREADVQYAMDWMRKQIEEAVKANDAKWLARVLR